MLSQHRTLLIFDNFGQFLPAAAALRLYDEVEYPAEPPGLARRVRDAAPSAAV